MANNFSVTFTGKDQVSPVAAKVNSAIAQVGKPIANMRSAVSAFSKETGLDKLGRSIEKVGIFATESARRVGSIAPPIAALTSAATIAGVAALAASWGKSAVQIRNTAYNIGMGTTQLQEYQGAAKLAGLSSETMTSGLQSVGKAFEDASAGRNSFVMGVLSQFGIGIHRVKNGSIDVARAMHDISDAAAKLPNAQARNEFLGFFGAQGLAPLLGQGAGELDRRIAQMRALNATMSPKQIAQGDRYNEAMVGLDFSVMKLTNSVGASLAPAFTKVAEELIPIADRYGPRLAAWIDSINWDKAIADTERFVDSIGGVKTIAGAVAAITFAGPIAGAITLAGKLASIAGTVGKLAANPVVTGLLALLHSEDLNKGEDQKLADVRLREQYAMTHGGWTPEMSQPGWKPPAGWTPDSATSSSAAPVAADAPRLAAPGGSAPLGIRTNNPLNMQPGGRQSAYESPEAGIADAVSNLERNYQGLTIAQIHDKWTGGARTGNTPEQIANYRKIMSQATGLGVNDVPDLSDPRTVSSLVGGMIRAENGSVPYTAQQLAAATMMGMQGGGPRPTPASQSTLYAPGPSTDFYGNPVDPRSFQRVPEKAGKAEILVRFENAPRDMKASVASSDGARVSLKIAHSNLLGEQV